MNASSEQRRTAILNAALVCFLDRGYRATTISDIRERSSATTGSIYHFFGSKAAIARELLDQAVAGWSEAAAVVERREDRAETLIKAAVASLVDWGTSNPALLRFMDEIRTIADSDPDFAPVRTALAEGHRLGAEQYAAFVARGEVKPMAFPLAHSLMLGPAYNYLRLVSGGAEPASRAAEELAQAGWDAVRSR